MANASIDLLRISERSSSTPCQHCSPDHLVNHHPNQHILPTRHLHHRRNQHQQTAYPYVGLPGSQISPWCDGRPPEESMKRRPAREQKRTTHATVPRAYYAGERTCEDTRKHFTDPTATFKHYDDFSSYAQEYRKKFSSTSSHVTNHYKHRKRKCRKEENASVRENKHISSQANSNHPATNPPSQPPPPKHPHSNLPVHEQMMLACQPILSPCRIDDPRFPMQISTETHIQNNALCPKMPSKSNIFHTTFISNAIKSRLPNEDLPSVTVYHYLDKNNQLTNRPSDQKCPGDASKHNVPQKTSFRYPASRQTTVKFPNIPEGSLVVGQKEAFHMGTILSTSLDECSSGQQNKQSDVQSEATPPSLGQSLSSLRNDVSSMAMANRGELEDAETFHRMSIVPVLPEIPGTLNNDVKRDPPLSLQLQGLAVSVPDDPSVNHPTSKHQQLTPKQHQQTTPRSDGTPRAHDSKNTPRRSNKPRPLGKPQAKHVVGQGCSRRNGPGMACAGGVAGVGGVPASNLCPPLRGCMVTRRQLKQRHSLQLARNVATTPPAAPPQSQTTYFTGHNVSQSTNGLLTTRGSKLDPSSSLRCRLLDKLKYTETNRQIVNFPSMSSISNRQIIVNR